MRVCSRHFSRAETRQAINDVTDLKPYLLENPDLFARCLTGKLLTFATGRPMSYGDKQVIEPIIGEVKSRENGLVDLIVTVVQSEVFRGRLFTANDQVGFRRLLRFRDLVHQVLHLAR